MPEIVVPMFRILDAMFAKWDIRAVENILGSDVDILNKLLRFMRSMCEYDRFSSVYFEGLRVWNRIFVRYGEMLEGTDIALGLVDVLMRHLQQRGALKLPILFLLSNILAFPVEAERFLARRQIVQDMFAHFDELDVKEKENFLLLVCHLIERHPIIVAEKFQTLAAFINVSFEFVAAAKIYHLPLHFLRALTSLVRADPRQKVLLETEEAIEALEELAAFEMEDVASAAQQLLAESCQRD
jgi:hypothetical protein